ncbi:MAG: hypothetical protein CME06_05865 [Gemmatimonadetes bacterium]|nr:hypothetical protein [Gemmatimonadota bacterium]
MAEEEITRDEIEDAATDDDAPDDELSPDEVESLMAESGEGETGGDVLAQQEAEIHSLMEEETAPSDDASVYATPMKLEPLDEGSDPAKSPNLDLVLDVHLPVVVELGRTRRLVKEILQLQRGSVITLDKMAGEPANLVINGIVMALGEIVVIDDNFGIRITKMVSRLDRLQGSALDQ